MKSIFEFFEAEHIQAPHIGILDIGAMLIEGQKKEYQPLLDAGAATVIGFEPVQEECNKLNEALQGQNIRFLPYFIGDGSSQTFCLNNASMTSSLFEANRELLDLFQNLGELTQTVKREEVQTTKLDDVPEIDIPIDYIKIDIQGAELQAFEGGSQLLGNTTVIHTEVEWVPLYEGQPLFAEVDTYLRKQGFLLHQILGAGTRAFKPFMFNNNPNIGLQQLWSDVVFAKDFTKLEILSDRQLCVYAILMHTIYNAFDIAALVLAALGSRSGNPYGDRYRAWLTSS